MHQNQSQINQYDQIDKLQYDQIDKLELDTLKYNAKNLIII